MKNIFKLLTIILIIILILPGCNQKNEEKKESSKKEEKKEEIPKQLEELEKDIEKIFKEAKGPAVIDKQEQEKEKDSQGQSESGGESQGQSKEGEQEGGSDEQKEESQGNQEKEKSQEENKTTKISLKKDEKEISQEITTQEKTKPKENNLNYVSIETSKSKLAPIVKDIHYKWNTYMPMAIEKGIDTTTVENFSNTLNKLTVKSESISDETLVAASDLYGFIPNFYALYKTKTPPDIKSIRHFTRNSIISSMVENWEQANEDIKNLVTTWSVLKNTLNDKQKDISNKIDYSISEIEKVISEKNKVLVDMKGRVLLSNIQELEKKMEESKE